MYGDMIRKLRRKGHFWLRLLLALQVAGLLGHAVAWGAAKSQVDASPSSLSAVLGYDVAICHHGRGDHGAPNPGSPDDCCAGGLCHCLSQAIDTPKASSGPTPRFIYKTVGVGSLRSILPARSPQAGPQSARGPPPSV